MAFPKIKTNLKIYKEKELLEKRQELLDKITKSDTYFPDSILHDDLDSGMLDYVKENFKVVSDGDLIPIIPRILTIQRWSEISNTWEFSDEDRNIKIPFIAIVRRPDVQPGTNPSLQRTIPDRKLFHYATVKTWDGNHLGANVYKMPQPVPIDIGYDITIVCHKFRDLNRFNKIILQLFSARQSYTTVKGHYVPIVLDKVSDNSPIDSLDGRRFYLQTYDFTMLGFIIDSEEFEIKPAINRLLLLTEVIDTVAPEKKNINKGVDITIAKFIADGTQTTFSVGESIKSLLYVTINGLNQHQDSDYYFIGETSKIKFNSPPIAGSKILIAYISSKETDFTDSHGKVLFITHEYFEYDGSTLTFTVMNDINNIIYLDINGLIDQEGMAFQITGSKQVTLLANPILGSMVGICYLY